MDMIPCPHGTVWHWLVDAWWAVTVCGGLAFHYGKTYCVCGWCRLKKFFKQ